MVNKPGAGLAAVIREWLGGAPATDKPAPLTYQTKPVEHKITGTRAEQVAFNDIARSAMSKGWTSEKVEAVLAEVGDYTKAGERIISAMA
jgi:hypothetical protein